jgi:hypothetical protein
MCLGRFHSIYSMDSRVKGHMFDEAILHWLIRQDCRLVPGDCTSMCLIAQLYSTIWPALTDFNRPGCSAAPGLDRFGSKRRRPPPYPSLCLLGNIWCQTITKSNIAKHNHWRELPICICDVENWRATGWRPGSFAARYRGGVNVLHSGLFPLNTVGHIRWWSHTGCSSHSLASQGSWNLRKFKHFPLILFVDPSRCV